MPLASECRDILAIASLCLWRFGPSFIACLCVRCVWFVSMCLLRLCVRASCVLVSVCPCVLTCNLENNLSVCLCVYVCPLQLPNLAQPCLRCLDMYRQRVLQNMFCSMHTSISKGAHYCANSQQRGTGDDYFSLYHRTHRICLTKTDPISFSPILLSPFLLSFFLFLTSLSNRQREHV